MNKEKDREKNRRFQAPKGVFVGLGPHFVRVGRLRELNMEGLTFRYLGNAEPIDASYVDIFMVEGNFYLGSLLIEPVSDVEVVRPTSSDVVTLRQCEVKFRKLTGQQKAKLKKFIETYTLGEV